MRWLPWRPSSEETSVCVDHRPDRHFPNCWRCEPAEGRNWSFSERLFKLDVNTSSIEMLSTCVFARLPSSVLWSWCSRMEEFVADEPFWWLNIDMLSFQCNSRFDIEEKEWTVSFRLSPMDIRSSVRHFKLRCRLSTIPTEEVIVTLHTSPVKLQYVCHEIWQKWIPVFSAPLRMRTAFASIDSSDPTDQRFRHYPTRWSSNLFESREIHFEISFAKQESLIITASWSIAVGTELWKASWIPRATNRVFPIDILIYSVRRRKVASQNHHAAVPFVPRVLRQCGSVDTKVAIEQDRTVDVD